MNTLQNISAGWSQWVLHAGWQSALVAGLVFVLITVLRRRISSQLRYAALLVVLLKFATPPFWALSTGVFSRADAIRTPVAAPAEVLDAATPSIVTVRVADQDVLLSSNNDPTDGPATDDESEAAAIDVDEPAREGPRSAAFLWLPVLMGIHICGGVWIGWRVIRRYLAVLSIVRRGEVVTPEASGVDVPQIAQALRLKSLPEMRLSDEIDGPFAIGAFHPVIVMPRELVHELDPDQLSIVMAHELAHVRRRDLLAGWLETLVSVVWWFHPAMWWLRKTLRQAREDCCDDVLLTCELAMPDRYCQTLIDAAARQSTRMVEPIVAGFTAAEHPTARRIRRLMDASLFRSHRLRWRAALVTVALGLVVLPGMQPDTAPVVETSLTGLTGWRNLPFQLEPDEEQAVRECESIAQTYFSTSNGKRVFHGQETREMLEALLQSNPKLFVAKHLLATWHRDNGNLETASRLFRESLTDAPVVLIRPYKYGNGEPLAGAAIQQVAIECNRVQNQSIDQSLKLTFIALMTNNEGEIHLPVYDTVYRLSSYSHVTGYHEESARMGFFESKSRRGILPVATVWRPWSQPRDFTRTASESRHLQDATGTQSLSLEVDAHTFTIGSVARAQADGQFVTGNGKGELLDTPPAELPDITNAHIADHAVIDLSQPDAMQFDIEQVTVLDSQTKIPLNDFQAAAGYKPFGNQRFHLFSFWQTLPESVDLVLDAYLYPQGAFRKSVSPQVGATTDLPGVSLKITHLDRGNHIGWSSNSGFYGEPRGLETTSELMFDLSGAKDLVRLSLWVALKDGRTWNLRPDGWFSISVGQLPVRIAARLEDIDHFEVRPYVERQSIYFEGLQLPARSGELQQPSAISIDFPINGQATEYTSNVLFPMQVRFKTMRGNRYDGISSGQAGYEFTERPEVDWNVDSESQVIWSTDVRARFNHQFEVAIGTGDGSDHERLSRQGGFSASGQWGQMESARMPHPVEKLRSARLDLIPVEPVGRTGR